MNTATDPGAGFWQDIERQEIYLECQYC